MTYSCFDVAKEILQLAKNENQTVAPMKLLKLTYIAHGYYLAFNSEALINNTVEAWKYGPVISELYEATKRFGRMPVDLDLIDVYSNQELNGDDKHFISLVWNSYKKYNDLQLSTMTHKEGTPWFETYEDNVYHKPISNKSIQDYYIKMINERTEAR